MRIKRAWYGSGEYHTGLFDPKRSGSRGFHEGIFDQGFGGFSTLKKRGKRSEISDPELLRSFDKRRPEMTSRGIHGDAFTGRCVQQISKNCVYIFSGNYVQTEHYIVMIMSEYERSSCLFILGT